MRKRIYMKEAIEVAGGALPGTKADLARELEISRQAIQQWNPRKPLPPIHVAKLKKLYPMKFGNRE